MFFRAFIRCLLFVAVVCILLSIGLLVISGNESSPAEIVAVREFLLHTREDVLNGNMGNRTNFLNASNRTDNNFDSNIVRRGQLQQALLLKYCSNLDKSTAMTGNEKEELFRHLVYDDNYGVIYCVVPRTGCTKMKALFLLLQGIYTIDELVREDKVTHKHHLHQVKTFADLTKSERDKRLLYYYKFMIVRDPLERLVSAYRNKISHKSIQEESFLRLRQDIIKEFRNENISGDSLQEIIPSFSEFVKYFLTHRPVLDDHFQTMFRLCQPCRINYDFYAHFPTLDSDMDALLELLKIPKYFYFNDIKIGPSLVPRNTSRLKVSRSYFNQLDDGLKEILISTLAIDYGMYNYLYPNNINN